MGSRRTRPLLLASAVLALGAAPAGAATLLADDFEGYPTGLITSEFSFWNQDSPLAQPPGRWNVTSGSLFAAPFGGSQSGYSGFPTGVTGPSSPAPTPDADNNSAVFRMTSATAGVQDATVSFRLYVQGIGSTVRTPEQAYDGIHVFLRYQSEAELYAVSVNRRDGSLAIKKKVPGGPSNGGTYYTLKSAKRGTHYIPLQTWQAISVAIGTNADGSVTITLSRDGAPLLTAVDDGTRGGPPITAPGRIGIRGDNAEFYVDDVVVDGPDVTAPATRLVSPADGATVRRRETVHATASDDVGVARLTLRLDGAEVATADGGELSSDVRFPRGPHTLELEAVDTSGNASRQAVQVTRPSLLG
jgi:hypothetical protein